jgi:type IV secretion system protein VirB10
MTWFNRKSRNAGPVDAVGQIDAQLAGLTDDRGAPNFGDSAPPMAPGAKGFLTVLALTAVLLVALLVIRLMRSEPAESAPGTTIKARIENVLPELKLTPSHPAPEPEPEPKPPEPVLPKLAVPELPGTPKVPALLEDPLLKRRLQPGLQRQDSAASQSSNPARTTEAKPQDDGPMADRLQPLRLSTAKAGVLADRDLLLTQGAMIDCVQQTRLVSAQAGMITCYATREVRSASGRVVLVDPGTKFIGYQQGVLAHGQPRIGVVWSRLETPQGVVVHLDSPGTGALGEAGLDGEIDTHFAERFGGAIMISLIDDLGSWLSSRGNNAKEGSIRFDNSSDAAQQAVTTVLDNTINIPPTLYRNQGGRVGIYVARDLDFSSVYALRPAAALNARLTAQH